MHLPWFVRPVIPSPSATRSLIVYVVLYSGCINRPFAHHEKFGALRICFYKAAKATHVAQPGCLKYMLHSLFSIYHLSQFILLLVVENDVCISGCIGLFAQGLRWRLASTMT